MERGGRERDREHEGSFPHPPRRPLSFAAPFAAPWTFLRPNSHFSPQLHNRFPHDSGQGRESIGGPRDVVAVLAQLQQHFLNTDTVSLYPLIGITAPGKVHQVEKGTLRPGIRYTETVNSQCTDVLVYLVLMYRNLIGIQA